MARMKVMGNLAILANRIRVKAAIHARMRVVKYPRECAILYGVECCDDELTEIGAIDVGQFARLARGIQHYAGISRHVRPIPVYCFGSSANVKRAPKMLRNWLQHPFGRGIWWRDIQSALVLFKKGHQLPIRRVIIHELVHGLLEQMTGGFPYPVAIGEGFARRAEYLMPDESGCIDWRREALQDPTGKKTLTVDQFMTIRELLFFSPRSYWGIDMSAFAKMTALAFWLNTFLSKIGGDVSLLRRILPELRMKNLSAPHAVYDWMIEASQMPADQLECAFLEYCMKGIVPRSGVQPQT